jgi:hypothetical protein
MNDDAKKKEPADDPIAGVPDVSLAPKDDRVREWNEFFKLCEEDDPEEFAEVVLAEAKRLCLTQETRVFGKGKNFVTVFGMTFSKVHEMQGDKVEHAVTVVQAACAKVELVNGVSEHKEAVPGLRFDRKSRLLLVEASDGTWQLLNEGQVQNRLMMTELSGVREGGLPSEIDLYIQEIIDKYGVDWHGPMAGYKAGPHTINGKPYLVTDSFQEIEPIPDPTGEHSPHIQAIVDGLFGKTQLKYFMAHLKYSRRCLREGLRMGGMATLIAGEPGVGKTFLIDCIGKPSLGNRSANVYSFLTGQTPFNKEMVGSEVHVIDDGNPFNDREARRQFTNAIKQSVASAGIYCHAKGLDGVTLPLYRRLFVVTNTDSLDAMPEMEQSLMDKVFLFKANKFKMSDGLMPLPPLNDTKKVKTFQAKLAEEMPYFLWRVDNYEVPEEIQTERFGLKAYKNPELWKELEVIGPGYEVHYLVQTALFSACIFNRNFERRRDGSVEVELNALYDIVLDDRAASERAKALFRNARAFGNALGHVGRFRKYYRRRKSHNQVLWSVKADNAVARVTETASESPESPNESPSQTLMQGLRKRYRVTR